MSPVELRIGLIGCGTVGSAFAASFAERAASLEQLTATRLRLARVAVLRPHLRDPRLVPAPLTDDAAALAADPRIDIVVEASGAPNAARVDSRRARPRRGRSHREQAGTGSRHRTAGGARRPRLASPLRGRRRRGRSHRARPARIARRRGDSRPSRRPQRHDDVRAGTPRATAARSRMPSPTRSARASPSAIRSDDLSGADAAAKLAILCSIAWREPVTVDRIRVRGIDATVAETVDAAREYGGRVRLVATRGRNGQHPRVGRTA